MEQYISKSALVAEIEKIRAEEMAIFEEQCRGGYEPSASTAVVWMKMEHLLSFIDTLEVKEVEAMEEVIEVDWEKEYKDYVEDDPVFSKLVNHIVGKAIARHFIELGLKVKKEE